MREKLHNLILLLIFYCLTQYADGKKTTINKKLGVIIEEDPNMILTDGEITLKVELDVVAPQISANGQCSTIWHGYKRHPEVTPNIKNSTSGNHKSEINTLSGLMLEEMRDTNNALVRKVQQALNLKQSPS